MCSDWSKCNFLRLAQFQPEHPFLNPKKTIFQEFADCFSNILTYDTDESGRPLIFGKTNQHTKGVQRLVAETIPRAKSTGRSRRNGPIRRHKAAVTGFGGTENGGVNVWGNNSEKSEMESMKDIPDETTFSLDWVTIKNRTLGTFEDIRENNS